MMRLQATLTVTLWAIWTARRKLIHEGVHRSPLSTHLFITRFIVELDQIKEALWLAEDLNLQQLHIASDCLEVVNGIRDGAGGPFGGIIKEINHRVRSFIVHVILSMNFELLIMKLIG